MDIYGCGKGLSFYLFNYLHSIVLRLWRIEEIEYDWEGRLVCMKINRAIDWVSKRMFY